MLAFKCFESGYVNLFEESTRALPAFAAHPHILHYACGFTG
jgi:hypothetical protein